MCELLLLVYFIKVEQVVDQVVIMLRSSLWNSFGIGSRLGGSRKGAFSREEGLGVEDSFSLNLHSRK